MDPVTRVREHFAESIATKQSAVDVLSESIAAAGALRELVRERQNGGWVSYVGRIRRADGGFRGQCGGTGLHRSLP